MAQRQDRHRSIGPSTPNSSTDLAARSKATHAITLECVKCCRGPRTSQIPSSGPDGFKMIKKCAPDCRSSRHRSQPVAARLEHGVRDLAVDIKLELTSRRVSDSNRPCAFEP